MENMERTSKEQQQEQKENETKKKNKKVKNENFAGKIELGKCVVRLIFKSDRFIIIK